MNTPNLPLIAHLPVALYDHDNSTRAGRTVVYDVVDLERRLAANEWLRTGEVSALVRQSRTAFHEWLKKHPEVRFTRTLGGQRKYHPDDVRRLLAEVREVHGGDESGPAPDEQGQPE